MFGYDEEQIAWFGLTFGVGAFMLYMVFIIFQLARESKAGRLGTFVLFLGLGFGLVATRGTGAWLRSQSVACDTINKEVEGRPHIVDLIKNGEITYIVNTTEGKQAIADSFSIRREALQHRVTYSTTIAGAKALLHSLDFRDSGPVWALQELHKELQP
jgi:hypothetical protein